MTPRFWVVAIIVAVIASLVSVFDGLFTAWSPWYNAMSGTALGTVPHNTLGPAGPLFSMLVITGLIAIAQPLRKLLKPAHLGILFAVLLTAFLQSGYPKWVLLDAAVGPYYITPQWVPLVPEGIWAPSKAVFDLGLPGGAPVPWGPWAGPIAYWIVWSIVIFLLGLSWSTIARRRLIDIALLPYPYAMVASEPINLVTVKAAAPSTAAPARVSRKMLVIIGLIICLLFYTPVLLRKAFPWFPDVYGWESWPFIPWHAGSLDITVASPSLQAATAGDFMWNTNPFWYAGFYLVSLDITFTTWVGWLVFLVIIPQIAWSFGMYPTVAKESHNRAGMIWSSPPTYTATMGIGLIMAVFVFELLVFRKYYAGTFRKPPEEKGEALPYKIAWASFLASFIILVGMVAAAGTTIGAALFAIGGIFLYMVCFGSMYGEAGYWEGSDFADKGLFWWVLFPGQTTMTREWYVPGLIYGHGINDGLMAGTSAWQLASYRVGALTKANNRDVFMGLMMAVIVSNIIAIPTIIWSIYTFGHTKIPVRCHGCYACVFTPYEYVISSPPLNNSWPWLILGFILAGATIFMKARFAWFPFNVFGWILIITGSSQWLGIFGPAFVAWILKYLTIRIGGAEAYERYGVPFAIGIILGWSIYVTLFGMLSIYRWFTPL